MLENLGFGCLEDGNDMKKRLPPRFYQSEAPKAETVLEMENDPGLFGFESYEHFYEKIAQASLPQRFIDPNHELIKGFVGRRIPDLNNFQNDESKDLPSFPSVNSNLTITSDYWRSYEDVLDFTKVMDADATNLSVSSYSSESTAVLAQKIYNFRETEFEHYV